jgi:hypothetical protein
MPYKDKAKQAAWYQRDRREHPEKYKAAYKRQQSKVRRLHRGPTPLNVSQEVVRGIWLAQDKRCAICQIEIPFNGHMDHDHLTLKLRGMLCRNCNPGLGQFKHNPILLRAAADYIERYM